jgi:cell division protein ZapA
VEVEIYGERYTIRGGANEQQVKRLASEVDQQMRELALTMRTATPAKIAVLAALHLAHELHEVRARQQEKEADLDRRTFDLMETIEAELGSVRAR